MNSLDAAISAFLNRPAQHSELFDQTIVFLSNSDLVKGGVVVAAVWAAWFFAAGDRQRNRALLLAAICASLVTLFVARVLAFVLPRRVRPLLNPELHFTPPLGLPSQNNWTSWNSFPSDHAALFIALAAGVWLVSRRAGWALVTYVAVLICLPRMYVGIHYASDVLAGAALGVLVVGLCAAEPVRARVFHPISKWGEEHPGWFYFALYLLTFQIATLFWDVRVALSLCGFST